MAKASTAQKDFRHTWFIREWLETHRITQADLIRKLDWSRAKASDVYNGQQYTQSIVDDLISILPVEPYELLMHPDQAMAFRRIRADALRIATEIPIEAPTSDREAVSDHRKRA